jgi:hypothetical protein
MDWSNAIAVLKETKAPSGYELNLLQRKDVLGVTEDLREWYPDLKVSGEACHLLPAFYYQQTKLADVDEDRSILPVVASHDGGVVALITFEKDSSRTLTCRIGVIAPSHRGVALATLGPSLLENMGRAMGAELVFYFATLRSPHQQVLAERFRYTLVGIIPAVDRNFVGGGEVKRVYEAVYAKVLVGDAEVALPPSDALTARTRAVWDVLFKVR